MELESLPTPPNGSSLIFGSGFAYKLRDPLHGDLQLVHAGGIAAADVAFAAGTERGAGHDGDLLLLEQAEGEIVRGLAGRFDRGYGLSGHKYGRGN